jgi:hypothetical protein
MQSHSGVNQPWAWVTLPVDMRHCPQLHFTVVCNVGVGGCPIARMVACGVTGVVAALQQLLPGQLLIYVRIRRSCVPVALHVSRCSGSSGLRFTRGKVLRPFMSCSDQGSSMADLMLPDHDPGFRCCKPPKPLTPYTSAAAALVHQRSSERYISGTCLSDLESDMATPWTPYICHRTSALSSYLTTSTPPPLHTSRSPLTGPQRNPFITRRGSWNQPALELLSRQ